MTQAPGDKPKLMGGEQMVRSFLAGKTDAQLREALMRGQSEIETLDWLEQSEDMHGGGGNGPCPLSKSYEEWSGRDYAYRRRMIESAICDTEAEMARRSALSQGGGDATE